MNRKSFFILPALIAGVVFTNPTNLFAITPEKPENVSPTRGRYLLEVAGCNDCHTPDYIRKEGKVPDSDWLTGISVGWKGPWGITYGSNLRLSVSSMTEDEWINYAKSLKTRPPMPWWSLHTMSITDLRSMYRFITSLGPKGEPMPAYVAPGEPAKTPFIVMEPQLPEEQPGTGHAAVE